MSRNDIAATGSGPTQEDEVLAALMQSAELQAKLVRMISVLTDLSENGLPGEDEKEFRDARNLSDFNSADGPLIFENRIKLEHVSKEFFSVDEAADYLCSTPTTIRGYVKRKRLQAHQVGRRLVFSKRDLDSFMRGQKCSSSWLDRSDRRTDR